jgi:hypothetical protein
LKIVAALHLQRDRLARQRLHEDLHRGPSGSAPAWRNRAARSPGSPLHSTCGRSPRAYANPHGDTAPQTDHVRRAPTVDQEPCDRRTRRSTCAWAEKNRYGCPAAAAGDGTALLLSDLQGQLARQAAGADPYTRPGLRIGPSVRRTERQGCASWWPRALREPGPHCAAQHTHAGPCKRDYDRRAAPATTTLPPIRGRRAAAVTACHPDPPAARAPALCRTAHRRSLLLLLLQLRRRRRLLLL